MGSGCMGKAVERRSTGRKGREEVRGDWKVVRESLELSEQSTADVDSPF